MRLTADQVRKVARLANLPLSPKEETRYSEQLSRILDYIDQLSRIDTTAVKATFNVTPSVNTAGEDRAEQSLTAEEALQNATKVRDGYFVTRGVFEEN